jgi:prephenate dehydratase
VGEGLAALRRICADVRFVGSYPRADGSPTAERVGTSDLAFSDALAWVEALRRGD